MAVALQRVTASALCLNPRHEILLVKPTYRPAWLLPGGKVEPRESPHAGCIREVTEELGLTLPCLALLCVEHYEGRGGKPDTLHFLFEGGLLTPPQIAAITLPRDELCDFRFLPLDKAIALLAPRAAGRLPHAFAAWQSGRPCYLESGAPLAAP